MLRESRREDGSLRVQTVNDEPEVTKQSFKDDADINFILRDYSRSGVVRHLNEARARYADVSDAMDYSDALMVVKSAEAEFFSLPVKVRKVFRNSPAAFLDAAHDPAKRELLERAGLIPPELPRDRVNPVPEAPAPPEP